MAEVGTKKREFKTAAELEKAIQLNPNLLQTLDFRNPALFALLKSVYRDNPQLRENILDATSITLTAAEIAELRRSQNAFGATGEAEGRGESARGEGSYGNSIVSSISSTVSTITSSVGSALSWAYSAFYIEAAVNTARSWGSQAISYVKNKTEELVEGGIRLAGQVRDFTVATVHKIARLGNEYVVQPINTYVVQPVAGFARGAVEFALHPLPSLSNWWYGSRAPAAMHAAPVAAHSRPSVPPPAPAGHKTAAPQALVARNLTPPPSLRRDLAPLRMATNVSPPAVPVIAAQQAPMPRRTHVPHAPNWRKLGQPAGSTAPVEVASLARPVARPMARPGMRLGVSAPV